jgi:hypothetical protein
MICSICKKETDKYTEIEIDDFEYKVICSSCMTKKLDKLIDDATYKHQVYITAASDSLRANEELEKEIKKKQRKA